MALREILAEFGFDVDMEAIQKADSGIARVTKSLGVLTAAFAAGGALLGVGRFAAQMASAADSADKAARTLGITTRALVSWRQVVTDAGGEVEQFDEGLKNLSIRYRDAVEGGEDQVKQFKKLGVALKDSQGRLRSLDDVLLDTVTGLRSVENAAVRAAIADDIFSDAGKALIRVSLDGAEALAEQRKQFDALNQGGRFDRFVEVSKENATAFKGWHNAVAALQRNLATALLPSLTALVKAGTAIVEWFQEMSRGSRVLEVALGALTYAIVVAGAAFLAAFWYPIAIVTAVAAAIAAVILVVDDLIALFSGGKSVIGAAIDALLGAGQAEIVVESIKEAWEDLTDAVAWFIHVEVEGWRAIVGAVRSAIAWISARVDKLISDARSLAAMLGPEITAIWETVVTTLEPVVRWLEGIIDGIVEKVTGAIAYVKDLAGSAADLLGFGDDEGGGAGAPLQVPVLPAQRRAVVDRRGPAGTSSVRVEQPVTVNVSGSLDPSEVARRVREEIDQRQTEQLELARELLLGAAG